MAEVIFKNYPFSVPAFYALVVRCWVEVGPGTEHLAGKRRSFGLGLPCEP